MDQQQYISNERLKTRTCCIQENLYEKYIQKNDTQQTFIQITTIEIYSVQNKKLEHIILYYIISNSIFIPLRQRFLTKTFH